MLWIEVNNKMVIYSSDFFNSIFENIGLILTYLRYINLIRFKIPHRKDILIDYLLEKR